MAIAPIGGLSTYSPISSIQPLSYTVENEGDFSDVYNTEATKQTAGVNGVTPVKYPDATTIDEPLASPKPMDPVARQKRTLQVSSDFNDIAMQFDSHNTSYSMSGVGASYSVAGSGFDAYA